MTQSINLAQSVNKKTYVFQRTSLISTLPIEVRAVSDTLNIGYASNNFTTSPNFRPIAGNHYTSLNFIMAKAFFLIKLLGLSADFTTSRRHPVRCIHLIFVHTFKMISKSITIGRKENFDETWPNNWDPICNLSFGLPLRSS